MRTMLQLLGGVAVAGAVAAGTTAFTAGTGSGLASTITPTSVIGGRTTINVDGATLSVASFTVDSANSLEDHVTGVNLTLKSSNGTPVNITTGTVTATISGTAAASAAPLIACVYSGGAGIWNCPVIGAPTKYFTAVDALTVTVVSP